MRAGGRGGALSPHRSRGGAPCLGRDRRRMGVRALGADGHQRSPTREQRGRPARSSPRDLLPQRRHCLTGERPALGRRPSGGGAAGGGEAMSDEMLLVTGGASGIGRAVVRLAAQRHWRVCIIDRDGAALESAAAEALEHGADKVQVAECDVSSEASMQACFDAAEEQLGPLSGLFTSAGIERRGFAHETPYETWQNVIETNLNGTFLACQLALRSLLRSKIRGSLVLCSSPASFVAYSAGAASSYSASKGGVSALVRTLAVDYAQHGIRVNAVVPGATETPLMWANSDESE